MFKILKTLKYWKNSRCVGKIWIKHYEQLWYQEDVVDVQLPIEDIKKLYRIDIEDMRQPETENQRDLKA